jgi:hypothetical protein
VVSSRTIGEGFVRLRPETRGFKQEADLEIGSPWSRMLDGMAAAANRLAERLRPAGAAAGGRFGDGLVAAAGSRIGQMLPGLLRAAGITAVGIAMGGVTSHAVALTSTLAGLIGILAVLPASAIAAAAGIGTLALGLSGLAAAWQASGQQAVGSGASQAAAARRTAAEQEAAARRVETAQRRVTAAEETLTQARQRQLDLRRELTAAEAEAAERLEDLTRALTGAQLDEEAATLAVADAERELERISRDRRLGEAQRADQMYRAELTLRQRQQTLAEVKDRLQDLTAEEAEATRRGIADSVEVERVRRRQAEATEETAAAERALAEARAEVIEAGKLPDIVPAAGAAGVNAYADALAELAPNARRLIIVGRELAEVWRDEVQQPLQQRMWAGVADDLRLVSDRLLPVMSRRLVDNAGAWNMSIRGLLGFARAPAVVADVDHMLARTNVAAGQLGRSWVPLVSGVRHLGVVGSDFLPRIANWVLTISRRFDAWAAGARESGRAHGWIGGALDTLGQTWRVLTNVGGTLRAVFRAGDDGGATLDGLERITANIRAWADSDAGQAKMAAFFTTLRQMLAQIVAAAPALLAALQQIGPLLASAATEGGGLEDTLAVTATVMGFLADNADLLGRVLPFLVAGFIAFKVAQAGANVAAAVATPLRIFEIIAQRRLVVALRAHTAALGQLVAAQRGQAVSQALASTATGTSTKATMRNTIATTASRVAAIGANIAVRALAIGQMLLNAALSPVGLIVIAIVAAVALLAAGIYLLWTRNETFRAVVLAVWEKVKAGIKHVVDWLVGVAWPLVQKAFMLWLSVVTFVYGGIWNLLVKLVKFIADLPATIRTKAKGLFDGVVEAAKGGLNKVIDMWNRLDIGVDVKLPGWLGGASFKIPDLFPDIPRLAAGGVARARPGGILANIAEGGEDEVVAPLSTLVRMLRDAVRDAGGGRGTVIEKLIIKAFSDRFSLRQVTDELAMHGVS